MATPIQSLMGVGFIGKAYYQAYPEITCPEARNTLVPHYADVLYTISTVDNYAPLRGDFHIDIDTNLTHLMKVWPNVRGTFNFLSSFFVYNRPPGAICRWEAPANHRMEWDECWPMGAYAVTKHCAEQLIQTHCATAAAGLMQGPTSYRILRLCNVIGNDPRAGKQKNALEYMLRRIVRGEEVQVYEGTNHRNYLHVDDVCRAIHLCLEKQETLNGITNIGARESIPLIDIIEHAKARVGSSSPIVRVPVPPFHRIVQVPDFWMNTTKLQSLGFTPSMTAFQAVDRVLEGILRQEALDRVSAYTDHIQHAP